MVSDRDERLLDDLILLGYAIDISDVGWVHGYVVRAEQLEDAFLAGDEVVDA
jgi:hypothetical protein